MLKRIHKMHFSISILLTVFIYSSSSFGASVTLEAPNETRDGSFVLKLLNSEGIEKVELYRNKDGGKYEKIVDVPCFKYISQVLLEDGIYGYKVRSTELVEQTAVTDFSQPVYISVNRGHQLLPNIDPTEARFSANF